MSIVGDPNATFTATFPELNVGDPASPATWDGRVQTIANSLAKLNKNIDDIDVANILSDIVVLQANVAEIEQDLRGKPDSPVSYYLTGPSQVDLLTQLNNTDVEFSVGPTGGGTTVIWAGLDQIPTLTVDQKALLKITARLEFVGLGGSLPINPEIFWGEGDTVGSFGPVYGHHFAVSHDEGGGWIGSKNIEIVVDSNRKFTMKADNPWVMSKAQLFLKGFQILDEPGIIAP